MESPPAEFATALSAHGWTYDRDRNEWFRGDSFVFVEGARFVVGVRERGIQPGIRREVSYEAALAWVRRELDVFARLANRRS